MDQIRNWIVKRSRYLIVSFFHLLLLFFLVFFLQIYLLVFIIILKIAHQINKMIGPASTIYLYSCLFCNVLYWCTLVGLDWMVWLDLTVYTGIAHCISRHHATDSFRCKVMLHTAFIVTREIFFAC